jgi:hypothetical protein
MIADVRHHLRAAPFEPFSIVMSSGDRYSIASADHAGIHPRGSRVVVWFDDESSVTVSAPHIVGIEKKTGSGNGGTE